METETDEILFAKAAYAAYGKTTGFKNYQGLPMPEWDALTPTIRSAWINAANEVRWHITIKFNMLDLFEGVATPVVSYREKI